MNVGEGTEARDRCRLGADELKPQGNFPGAKRGAKSSNEGAKLVALFGEVGPRHRGRRASSSSIGASRITGKRREGISRNVTKASQLPPVPSSAS